jgi:hypothetical protein
MPSTDAYHLPAIASPATTGWSYGEGAIELRIAQLSPSLLYRQVEALATARERHLAERPVAEIVAAIDAAAARLADPADELRQLAEAALPHTTGYSVAMVRRVLNRMTDDWRAERLTELLRAEFSDPRMLDDFRARATGGGRSRAFGPRLTTHIFSGNVPGVAVTSLIRALLVKSASIGKTATREPLLAVLFARALTSVDAGLGACLAVTYWPGGASELEAAVLERADAVIAYGSDETVRAVRAKAPPQARFLGYGHKLSFGVVAREHLSRTDAPALAQRAAHEVATFDQHGCVSPHLFYAEEGGDVSPQEWAGMVADALDRIERVVPRGTLSPSEAAAIRQLRGEAEFAQIAGTGVELYASGEGTHWTVIYERDPGFAASCLNRVVRIKPVASIDEVADLARPIGALLQTVGLAAPAERARSLTRALGTMGASRVAPIGRMAWPSMTWHHDGQSPVGALVRWCDLEAEEPSPLD